MRPDGKEHRIFESHLKLWRQCPARFYYAYIDTEAIEPLPKGYGLRLGSSAHEALEALWKWAKQRKYRGPVDEIVLRRARVLAHRACKKNDVGGDGEDLVVKRVQEYLTAEGHIDGPSTVSVERFYRVIPTAPPGIHIPLVGIFDRVQKISSRREPPHLEIIDYKLGAGQPDQLDIRSNLQMILYAIAATELWPWARRITTTLHLLGNPRERPRYTRARSTVLNLAREVLPDLQEECRKQLEGPWPANPGDWCGWCQFRHDCPAFTGMTPEQGARMIEREHAFQERKRARQDQPHAQSTLFDS